MSLFINYRARTTCALRRRSYVLKFYPNRKSAIGEIAMHAFAHVIDDIDIRVQRSLIANLWVISGSR